MTISKFGAFIALLISISATYNAYILRGGRLAWSEVLIALGMVAMMFSLVFTAYLPSTRFILGMRVSDSLFILGFLLLLAASMKLRSSLK